MYPGSAFTYLADGLGLRCQYNLVQISLRPAELAIDRKRTGDIRRISIIFSPGINQQQVAVIKRVAVTDVMLNTGIGATADNWYIRSLTLMTGKGVQQLGMNFCLIHTRLAYFHRPSVSTRCNSRRFPHGTNFCAGFEQTHLVQAVIE